ncbi:MAG: hypothetical protein ACRDX9_10235 [Acidimicrobiia bacterium]
MRDWVRWLVIGVALVLVLALVAYARGERQRGEVEPTAHSVTLLVESWGVGV